MHKSDKRAFFVLLSFLLVLSGCQAKQSAGETTRTEFVLGTVCALRIDRPNDAAMDEAFERLAQLEALLTVNKEGSQIDAVNAAAGKNPVKVGPEAMTIIKRGLHYAELSNGGFDPSVGPLVKLWGIGSDHARLPSKAEIDKAKALINYKDIVLDEAASTVYLKRPGMALDLGSATKGYAADEVRAILVRHGVKSGIIDLGGNILVIGKKDKRTPWHVGLQDPDAERGNYIGIASLDDCTMVTSGVYERYFIENGVRYHHILSPFTGYPVQNGLTSVTIITKKSFDADGVTTMLFILGPEKGMELAQKLGIDVIMLDDQKRIFMTPGASAYFKITDSRYKLVQQ